MEEAKEDIEGRKYECEIFGVMKGVLTDETLSMKFKNCRLTEYDVADNDYDPETWSQIVTEWRRLDMFEMRCMWATVGVR